ncbi:MAG: patatin family protein, partial [Lachnospiraceae bacterium]|nr:patatin family protein [Lachnospiraceae bacterium]
VKTREWDYTRDEDPLMLNDLMYHKYPEFVESMNKANAEFNELNERLKVMHESGEVYVIAPSQPVIVKRFEGDMEKLGDLYWLGFNDAKAQLDAIKGYLGI